MDDVRRAVLADDGVVISYVVSGDVEAGADEPPVVILHGLAGSGREFAPTAHALTPRRTIRIDLRGHGHSTRVPIDVSRAAFVVDVVRVIEAEATGAVDLVGQSMGAHTAMLVAAARPDLVRRLVLLEGDQGGGSAEEHEALGAFFRSWQVPFADRAAAVLALGDAPLAAAWVADLEPRADGLYPRFDADVMVRVIREVAQPRWREWERVSAPTLVVYADGGMFTEAQRTAFVERRPGVRSVELVGASHDAHLDAFEQWMAVLRDFLGTSVLTSVLESAPESVPEPGQPRP